MDGIIKETPSNTACSSNVQSVVMQEAEEEIGDDEKSDEGNCFDMFELSNVITNKTNLMF